MASTQKIRVKTRYNLKAYFTDNFNRPNQINVAVPGLPWSVLETTYGDGNHIINIASNQLSTGNQLFQSGFLRAGSAWAYWNDPIKADQFAEMVITSADLSSGGSVIIAGPMVRMANNIAGTNVTGYHLAVYWNFTNQLAFSLIRIDNSGPTPTGGNIHNYAIQNMNPGDVVRLEITGSTLLMKINGVQNEGTYTDTTYAAGMVGFGVLDGSEFGPPLTFSKWNGGEL